MPDLTAAEWRFWGRWTAAMTFAIAVCAALGPVGLMGGPLLLALAQGLALLQFWRRSAPWFIATLVGGYLALAAALGIVLWYTQPLLIVVVGGAILGLLQGLVLRSRSRYWYIWPGLTILVLLVSVGWFMPPAIDAAIYGSQWSGWRWMAMGAASGAIGGGLKGWALIGLSRSRQSS